MTPKYLISRFAIISVAVIVFACGKVRETETTAQPQGQRSLTVMPYGSMDDGHKVNLYTLTNVNGVQMSVMNYGGIIVSLKVPDRNGNLGDVVLGYDALSSYMASSPFFGALIGRYGNRIAKGKFTLDGKQVTLPTNDGPNHLHGGPHGFDKVYWKIEVAPDSTGLILTYHSADGEQGYPGNLDAKVRYTLTDKNELKIEYSAVTDKKTVVNLTQHSYFNLTGDPHKTILGHRLKIDADRFLPVNATLIPTGELRAVKGKPFDFTKPRVIGSRINADNEQLTRGKGYDHCWVLNDTTGLHHAATLTDSVSGRKMEVLTTEPGLQFYTGNFLDGTLTGKSGIVYKHRTGLCLETEHFPDSPNHPAFSSVVLNPGKTYQTTTVYRFSVSK